MRLALIAAAIMASLIVGYVAYVTMIGNPRVVTDLKEHPMGERAERAKTEAEKRLGQTDISEEVYIETQKKLFRAIARLENFENN